MRKLLLLLMLLLVLPAATCRAAIFSSSPKLLQESSSNVKIYFDPNADGVPATLKAATEVYAHIGVTLTSDPSTWTYVKGTWSTNTADKKFTKTSTGLWELTIGDLRTYFGITNSNDKIAKIAIIARNAAGTAQTADNFIDVLDEGFQIALSYDASSLVLQSAKTITFTIDATENSQLSLSVNGTEIANAANANSLSQSYNFAQKGTFYTVKATATNSSNTTLTQEVTVAYPETSSQANYPGGIPKQGAVKNADGTVTFCIAAPNKTSVILVPSWDNYQTLDKNVMSYQDYQGFRYFWVTTTTKLEDNQYYPYYYLVDGTIKVADPYAHLILDPYSDKWLPAGCFENMPAYPYDKFDDTMLAVYRGDMDSYNWDNATTNFQIPNHAALNIYEILLRDFTGDGDDSDGKTYGTLRQAKAKISYLKKLGINAVELMPIMEFTGNSSWGYNTNAYMAIDKAYGSPTDMRDFVAECHRNGIAVILDIVFNQSDGLHPWYQMYPISSNPFYNETAPHSYSVLNDWNQDCALVTQHWKDVITFWMESYKVDGFRFDLVKGLGSNSSYSGGTDGYNATRIAKMKELHAAITAVNPNGIHINELLGDTSEEKAMGADGQMNWNKVSNGAYQYAMGYEQNNGDTKGFYAPNWGEMVGQTVDYAESHDEERVAAKVKSSGHASVSYTSSIKAATVRRLGSVAAQMLMSPGAKMIWQFGEVAADDAQGSDTEKLRAITPKWDYFTNSNRAELYENYRQLCNLRLNNPEMFNGEASVSFTGFSNSLTTGRTIRLTNGDKEIIAFFNPAISGSAISVTATSTRLNANNCQLITASAGTTATLTGTGSNVSVSLPAHSFAVFATAAVSDIESIINEPSHNVSVWTNNGTIVIDGTYTSASVYNMQGTAYHTLNVPSGLYIVVVDGTPYKVAVK